LPFFVNQVTNFVILPTCAAHSPPAYAGCDYFEKNQTPIILAALLNRLATMLAISLGYDYHCIAMKYHNEKIPNPREVEKEIGEFLAKKFGSNVKIVSPLSLTQEDTDNDASAQMDRPHTIDFDLKPEELIAYLDQYVVKQDHAKAILATKICTHFNRIRLSHPATSNQQRFVGQIKNNILMIGPTGVGKTYLIKLIADRIGVPFVKGDATKFSETGYVGGDVEDLVRDLVRAADDDIHKAQYGIIYIDEIDKIAGARNLIGADVSRTGVQRALLKPMEETEVDLKVPHDPVSMIEEIERFRKSGQRERRVINTANILFIMSGAFNGLDDIIAKRLQQAGIGFGADLKQKRIDQATWRKLQSQDLIKFGFESEFIGRLPVRAIFETLDAKDLLAILKNPNNPIILSKKLDFSAYGIALILGDNALTLIADRAFTQNTGARGLVSAVEEALLPYERALPSTPIRQLPLTAELIQDPVRGIQFLTEQTANGSLDRHFQRLLADEKRFIRDYLRNNCEQLSNKINFSLTPERINTVASYYSQNILDITQSIQQVKSQYDEIKKIELFFYKNHDINIVLEDDAIDYLIAEIAKGALKQDAVLQRLEDNFEHGLKLVREKTGRSRFFITRRALQAPESYVGDMIKDDIGVSSPHSPPQRPDRS
jgi:endopeptidase Clp ATP-binding regulatory subunit ClpX